MTSLRWRQKRVCIYMCVCVCICASSLSLSLFSARRLESISHKRCSRRELARMSYCRRAAGPDPDHFNRVYVEWQH